MMKIMILGGYGVFGGRLARLLATLDPIELLICGRDGDRARRFCAAFEGPARVRAVVLDRRDVADALRAERPDLLVDASGPFQDYGNDRYGVIKACIAARVDYLDFADAADFVAGVADLDGAARVAGRFALSGVSSFPVLTAAVLREMAKTMDVVAVEGGIAPSPYAGIGLNVMRAVVGYAGAPVALRRGGRTSVAVGLAESRRRTIAVPGRLPLRNIRFSLVDVPDLQVIPPEHPTMTDIWMGAGPVPESLHRILNLLAKARARFRLPSLVPLAPLFYAVLNRARFGEHRGGMFVHARGVSGGRPLERGWHLVAEGDDGPLIPSMAIEAIVRKLAAGVRPSPGARSGVGALELADYDALFRRRAIATGFREDDPTATLYRRVLGPAIDALPAPVRALHDATAVRRWTGTADVGRGRGPLAALVATLFGFPRAGRGVPVTVTIAPAVGGGEVWTRDFARRCFRSHQSPGAGRDEHLLVERSGIVAFALALVVEGDRLHLVARRWSVCGMPMPRALLPAGATFETANARRFEFSVDIRVPVIGPVVSYSGWLEPEPGA